MRAAGLRRLLLLLLAGLAAAPGGGGAAAEQGGLPAKKLRMAYATGPLLKFQIW
uniref:Selenoprotein T n=1 Tax=Catharus ustulatus TaxID=91951 RepID=A0A8C3V9X1_CATUS